MVALEKQILKLPSCSVVDTRRMCPWALVNSTAMLHERSTSSDIENNCGAQFASHSVHGKELIVIW